MHLGILNLPRSEKEALTTPKHVIDLRRCAICGHLYHTEFEDHQVEYRGDSTLVFNKGSLWAEHQRTLAAKWIAAFGRRKLSATGLVDRSVSDFLSR